ncbi:unnamed protein product, partial [Symbiodinium sp. KB8]
RRVHVPVVSFGVSISRKFTDAEHANDKSPAKRPRGAGMGVKIPAVAGGVTLDAIQALLAQQSATLMEAQRATMAEMEVRQNARFQKVEQGLVEQKHVAKDLKTYIEDLEDRMTKVERAAREGPAMQPAQQPRRLTLVFGGWATQTRRHIILHQLSQAVTKLDLQRSFDSSPFTTGPRRSVALCNFEQRTGESLGETRARMMTIITAINSANAQLDGGEKALWCSFSRTPQERGKAALPGFVKRVVMTHKPDRKEDLDIEYYSGKSWIDETQLSGLGDAPISPGVLKVDTRAGPGWIDAEGLAMKTGVAKTNIQQMVEGHKF